MTSTIRLMALLAALAVPAAAQTPYEVKRSSESSIDFHTSNYGIFGLDVAGNRSGFTAPRGSNHSYLFGSGLWFGARKNVDGEMQKLTFITYNPNSGASWAEPGEAFPPVIDTIVTAPPRLYHSVDYDHTTGEYTGPTVPPSSPSWPLWLLPGEQTDPLHTGAFVGHMPDRRGGDVYSRPSFMPGVDEQFFARFHDRNLDRYEIAASQAVPMGFPIGLQIQQHAYAWEWGPLKNVVVLQYDIINVSGDTLYDCAVAQAADPDLGTASNDHLGFYTRRPELRTAFVWTEQETTEYGALAITLLEAPVADTQGFIDNGRRLDYMLNGRVHTSPNWGIETDPKTPQERYDYMTSGTIDVDTDAGDRRTLLASTTFNMRPGDTAHYAMAFSVISAPPSAMEVKGSHDHTIASAGGEELETLVTTLTEGYYDTFTRAVVSSVDHSATDAQLTVVPNPAASMVGVEWSLRERSNVTIEVRNSIGQQVAIQSLGSLDAGIYRHQLDVTVLPAGVYVLVVRDNQGARAMRLAVTR